MIQGFEIEFNKRPKSLGQKASWLLDLEKTKERAWYDEFFEWYTEKLLDGSKHHNLHLESLLEMLRGSPGEEDRMRSIVETLVLENNTKIVLGFYNSYQLALSPNRSALDPPTMPFESLASLGLQHIVAGYKLTSSKGQAQVYKEVDR